RVSFHARCRHPGRRLSRRQNERGNAMVRIIAAILGLGLMLTQAQAVEIKLLASNALKSVLQEVAPQFEQSSGNKLAITFGSTGNLTASITKRASAKNPTRGIFADCARAPSVPIKAPTIKISTATNEMRVATPPRTMMNSR